MTIDELQALTDHEFKFIALDKDDNIKFAVPIPGERAWRFGSESEAESFLWDSEEIEACEEAWERYVKTLTGKKNRSRKQAQKAGAITVLPEFIALPTLRPYQNAISTVQNPAAHLQPITGLKPEDLSFIDGKLYYQGMDISRIDMVQYCDNRPETISNLDLPMLRALYSVILQDAEDIAKDPDKIIAKVNDPQYLSRTVKIYLPDFLKMLGYKPNSSNECFTIIIRKIMNHPDILGVMREKQNGRENTSYYPVINAYYCIDDNTIEFCSPYMRKLIVTILQDSIQTDKKGNPKLNTSGEAFFLPSHSYIVNASITKEKNKRAVEIICIIVILIEQAGNHTPHIKAQTIINRCPELKNALEAATGGDKNKLLKRAFSKAWELLPKQTRLTEFYEAISLPLHTDSDKIPTMSTLNDVFEFPHKGKRKKR